MSVNLRQPTHPSLDSDPGTIALKIPIVISASRPAASSLWDPTLLDRLSTPISRIHE